MVRQPASLQIYSARPLANNQATLALVVVVMRLVVVVMMIVMQGSTRLRSTSFLISTLGWLVWDEQPASCDDI